MPKVFREWTDSEISRIRKLSKTMSASAVLKEMGFPMRADRFSARAKTRYGIRFLTGIHSGRMTTLPEDRRPGAKSV
jgi:hypothetical protein